jgi:hypothetical protein
MALAFNGHGDFIPRWNGFEASKSQVEEASRAIEMRSSIVLLKTGIKANSIGKTTQL